MKQVLNCFGFGGVVKPGGGTVRIDVIDLSRIELCTSQRLLHRDPRSNPRGIWLGQVVVVGGNAVPGDFSEDVRAATLRKVPIFQGENGGTFPKDHSAPFRVKRSAFVGSRSLQRI